MDKISTCRAAYLIPFIDILRDIGHPVIRSLSKSKLPTMIEEMPEEFISNNLGAQFIVESEDREGIDDLGWLWAKQFSTSTFSDGLQASLSAMPTVKARLDCFIHMSKLEDSDISVGYIKSNGSTEVFCDLKPFMGVKGLHIADWTQVMALIDIVRSIMGKNWSPEEIRFQSDFSVCNEAREANPNTRFLTQSAHTSIIMPSCVLAASKLTYGTAHVPDLTITDKLTETENLKRLIRPYLFDGAPKITSFAEIIDISPRSLQRKLKLSGSSYSQLIETTRFEMASEMLREPDTALIDVAMILGYENQSNFGRSFRRVAGISPGKYRREMFGQDNVAQNGVI